MKLNDMTLGDKKNINPFLAKNFCIFIKHCFKRVMAVLEEKKKKTAIKDTIFKCYQM